MKPKRYFHLIFLGLTFFFYKPVGALEQSTLTALELDKFIKDTPSFIATVKNKHLDGQLIRLFLEPDLVEEDIPISEILTDLHWEPKRYAYIFSHVIIGGFIRDMGEFGDGKIKFLKEQRNKWQESNEPDKEKIIGELDRSIREISEIAERTKKIPTSELLLFWEKRDALNDILMGKLPIAKKKLKKVF
jgi:hypothetical protein